MQAFRLSLRQHKLRPETTLRIVSAYSGMGINPLYWGSRDPEFCK